MGQHDQRHVMMPAVPTATLIVIQPEFLFELLIVLVAAGEGATLAGPSGPHRHRSMAVNGAQPLSVSHSRARRGIP